MTQSTRWAGFLVCVGAILGVLVTRVYMASESYDALRGLVHTEQWQIDHRDEQPSAQDCRARGGIVLFSELDHYTVSFCQGYGFYHGSLSDPAGPTWNSAIGSQPIGKERR